MNSERNLRRSQEDRVISGLCGGIGEFFGVDSTLVRVVFVLLAFAGGGGVVLYLVLTLVIPAEGEARADTRETVRRGAEDLADGVKHVAGGFRGEGDRSRNLAALLLILLGVLFLFRNLEWLGWLDAGWFWPLVLIGLGAWLLLKRR